MSDPRPKEPWRAHFLPAPACFTLDIACSQINKAFGEFGCYLVGSVFDRRDYRDVDVRFIMADEKFDRMFPFHGVNPLWSLMCLSLSTWLRDLTGLPVDFQIQKQSEANATYDGRRSALGIFVDPEKP